MKLPSLPKLSSLNSEQRYLFIMKAKASGQLPLNYTATQASALYRQQLLAQLGLNPDVDEEDANAYLKGNKLLELHNNNQLGGDTSPLLELYNSNPRLAAQLSDELFKSGYMTLDEILKASKNNINKGDEEGSSWLRGAITDLQLWRTPGMDEDQDPNKFSKRTFNDFYKEADKKYKSTAVGRAEAEENPEKYLKDRLEEARRMYLSARNNNIMSSIQKKIDDYYDSVADKTAESISLSITAKELGPKDSNDIYSAFNQIATGYTDEDGEKHEGSGYYRAYKDLFEENLQPEELKRILSKYKAYEQLFGKLKADLYLDNEMQTFVSDNLGFFKRSWETGWNFAHTVVDNVAPRMLSFGVWGLAELGNITSSIIGDLTGHEGESNAFGELASVISTGKNLLGKTPEESGFKSLSDNGGLFWLRDDYLNKVDQYNTWSLKEQQLAEANNGVSGNEMYVLKPGLSGPDFWSLGTLQDISGMTAQVVGQAASMWLAGGPSTYESLASLVSKGGAKALLSKGAAKATLGGMKDATLSAAPIAQSYAYGAYQLTYNAAKLQAQQYLQDDVNNEFMKLSATDEYNQELEKAYRKTLGIKKSAEGKTSMTVDTPEYRAYFKQQYDLAKYAELQKKMADQRGDDLERLALGAAVDSYMTSFAGEYLKYGMLNAALQPLKVFKAPEKVLQSEVATNTYGKMTQDAVGKFTNKGKSLLGIKKWTTVNPKVIGSYNVARNALVSGGWSNYTDELTTGFAAGFGLSEFNSEYLRQYNPQAYANTWHGGSAIGEYMDAIHSGVEGAVHAGLTELAAHAFEIGALGGIFAPRLGGYKKMKEDYARENKAREEAGEKSSEFMEKTRGFRQWFNTYVTGAVGEYEQARMVMKALAELMSQYNKAIDEREQLLSELGVLNQAIVNGQASQNSQDFSAAANALDVLAMKLVWNLKLLSSNPLHQFSNQVNQANIQKLQDIANDNVSDEEKNTLITLALSTNLANKQAPITDALRDLAWLEIQTVAKRTSDFVNDYNEAELSLREQDRSFEDEKNYPILVQRAELMAKNKRISRDIQLLAKDINLNIDSEKDGSYGEMEDSHKLNHVDSARELIRVAKEQLRAKLDKLKSIQEKLETETDEAAIKLLNKDATDTRMAIKATDRQISELNRGVSAIEDSRLLSALEGLSTDARVIDDMINNPTMYSAELQKEIAEFKKNIGPQGETYILELAKLQDELSNNKYSLDAIQENPLDFLNFTTDLSASRKNAINRAIYKNTMDLIYDDLATKDVDTLGPIAGVSLSPQLLLEFGLRHPTLGPIVTQFSKMSEAVDSLRELMMDKDLQLWVEVANSIANELAYAPEYFLGNERQGLADLLLDRLANDVKLAGNSTLKQALEDYLRVTTIDSATTAYTEYRRKRMLGQAVKDIERQIRQLQLQDQQLTQQQLALLAQQLQLLLQLLQAQLALQAPPVLDDTSKAPAATLDSDEDLSNETVPDMESMENTTGPAIDLGDTLNEPSAPETPANLAEPQAETKEEAKEEPKEEPKKDTPEPLELTPEPSETETPEPPTTEVKSDELPAGVTRDSDGLVETMTPELAAEQLNITPVSLDTLIDDSKPAPLETTNQLQEVHGLYFNPYDSNALEDHELVPYTEGPIYEWLALEGINLGAIVDDELFNVLKANPTIQLMKVKKEGADSKVASNIFLVVEYTDKVAKQHLPENGGVITSGGKQYLIIGNMWNTKALDGTSAASLVTTTRNTLQKNGVDYFTNNPNERFYVDPDMSTLMTTFNSGHVINTIDGESVPHSIGELIDNYNKTHTVANQMSYADLGFCCQTFNNILPVGPVTKMHEPLQKGVNKWGLVYVLVPAANGEVIPIFVNPVLLSEIKDGAIKNLIDNKLIPLLLDPDYHTREMAMGELCTLLCLSSSLKKGDTGKTINYGTENNPVITLYNNKTPIKVFDINQGGFTLEEFRLAIYNLNPRINLYMKSLSDPNWIKRYDEAGALMTDSLKLGTYGSKYYVAPIDASTGKPILSEPQLKSPVENKSDYTASSEDYTPTKLYVQGNSYTYRKGRWVHEDNTPITSNEEKTQVAWAYKVLTGEALSMGSLGIRRYYIVGAETSNPITVAYNTSTSTYEGVPEELANQLIQSYRLELEKIRAEEAAKKAKDLVLQPEPEAPKVPEVLITEAPIEAPEVTEKLEEPPTLEAQPITEAPIITPADLAPLHNDFELQDSIIGSSSYTLEGILSSTEELFMDLTDLIYDIIESKIQNNEKWKNFDILNLTSELERMGISTKIDNIDSWIDNLKNCE